MMIVTIENPVLRSRIRVVRVIMVNTTNHEPLGLPLSILYNVIK